MKTVPLAELKRRLSALIDEAAAGERILITRHRRPAASLGPVDFEHVTIGAKFGRGELTPLLRSETDGQYLRVLQDDRRYPDAWR